MKVIRIYNTLECSIISDSYEYKENAENYENEITKALLNEDTDLAPYADSYHGETFYKKLHQTRITVESIGHKLYGLAECTVTDDWIDSDTKQLKEYLTGQYSDGWGEGFEQREIFHFYETETCEEYDEENDETYESEYDVRCDVYVSFWQSKDYKIMTEDEISA